MKTAKNTVFLGLLALLAACPLQAAPAKRSLDASDLVPTWSETLGVPATALFFAWKFDGLKTLGGAVALYALSYAPVLKAVEPIQSYKKVVDWTWTQLNPPARKRRPAKRTPAAAPQKLTAAPASDACSPAKLQPVQPECK